MPFDLAGYERQVRTGPCFICALVAGDPAFAHHVIVDDGELIVFLVRRPTLLGHSLVAPKRHVEDWVGGLDEPAYLRMQAVVHRVARALADAVPTQRMYSLSLGSNQGNAHLHWHVAPLPPGVPYHRQQYHALMAENGVLDVDDATQRRIAETVRRRLLDTAQ